MSSPPHHLTTGGIIGKYSQHWKEVIPSDRKQKTSAQRIHNSELAVAECPLAIVYDPPWQTFIPIMPAIDNYPSLLLSYTKVHWLASLCVVFVFFFFARACSV